MEPDMKAVNLSKLGKHPVTMPLVYVMAIFSAGWGGQAAVTKAVAAERANLTRNYVTIETMKDHEVEQAIQFKAIDRKLNTLLAKDVRKDAYQTIANIEGDINRHNKIRSDNPAWLEASHEYQERHETAVLYKDCVMESRPNCDHIKERIGW